MAHRKVSPSTRSTFTDSSLLASPLRASSSAMSSTPTHAMQRCARSSALSGYAEHIRTGRRTTAERAQPARAPIPPPQRLPAHYLARRAPTLRRLPPLAMATASNADFASFGQRGELICGDGNGGRVGGYRHVGMSSSHYASFRTEMQKTNAHCLYRASTLR